jgi:hypothetical protein
MSRVQSGQGLEAISARKLNRAFDRTSDMFDDGKRRNGRPLPYTKAIAKNTATFAIVPGAPVEITTYTPDSAPEQGGRVPGFWTADRAVKPCTAKKRIAIALEFAEPDELFEIAIDGVVRANFDNTDFPFASLISDASGTDYQSKITSSPAMGFAMILVKIDSTSALIRFGACSAIRNGTTIGGITASSPTSPTEVDVLADIAGGGTETVKAFTVVSNIAATTKIVLLPVDGTFQAMKVC